MIAELLRAVRGVVGDIGLDVVVPGLQAASSDWGPCPVKGAEVQADQRGEDV